MAVRPILRWPDSMLSCVCAPVQDLREARALAADMFDTLYAAPGRGLAAPQVGVALRLFVMDVGWKDGAPSPVVCVNPEILEAPGPPVARDEGCLSIPGITASVARPDAITLAYTDLGGTRSATALTGFAATCAQHELDHLDGVVTLDRVDAATRAALLREYTA